MSGMNEVRMRELAKIRERVDALFEKGLTGTGLASSLTDVAWKPPVDVAETEEAFHLTFELPGVARDDIDLHLDRTTLVLHGSRRSRVEGGSYLRMERHHGDFHREIELGASLDPAGIEAQLERGLMTVRVAKKKPRRVEIRTVGDEE